MKKLLLLAAAGVAISGCTTTVQDVKTAGYELSVESDYPPKVVEPALTSKIEECFAASEYGRVIGSFYEVSGGARITFGLHGPFLDMTYLVVELYPDDRGGATGKALYSGKSGTERMAQAVRAWAASMDTQPSWQCKAPYSQG